ncbi:hypothetical protein BH09SUM1_BH09SUM1_20810 [soil metagenome]
MKKPGKPKQSGEWYSTEKVERAMRRAALDAATRHLRAGVPMTIFRDGKVLKIAAAELLNELSPEDDE